MVGLDISLSPTVWAVPHAGGWAYGLLERPEPGTLVKALREAGHRLSAIALAVPTRQVRIGTLPRAVRRTAIHKAALLAASQHLRLEPHTVAVSIDTTAGVVTYASSARDTVDAWVAPWTDAGLRVRVVEPAGVSLLRVAGRDDVELFVRAGLGELELVVGSRTQWGLSRWIATAWQANPASIRVEVEDTMDLARRAGIAVSGIVVGGAGPTDQLAEILSPIGPVRPLEARGLGGDGVPPMALVAAAVASWDQRTRTGPSPRVRRLERISRLWRVVRRRPADAT